MDTTRRLAGGRGPRVDVRLGILQQRPTHNRARYVASFLSGFMTNALLPWQCRPRVRSETESDTPAVVPSLLDCASSSWTISLARSTPDRAEVVARSAELHWSSAPAEELVTPTHMRRRRV